MPICTRCKIEKPDNSFYLKNSFGCRRPRCMECDKKTQRDYQAKKRELAAQGKSINYKICIYCDKDVPLSEFYGTTAGGLATFCKSCANEKSKKSREVASMIKKKGKKFCMNCQKEHPLSNFKMDSIYCWKCNEEINFTYGDIDKRKFRLLDSVMRNFCLASSQLSNL